MVKPRLLYIGDVPVEATYHGSALLHRLLSDYPPERLCIVESATPSLLSRRLSSVNYHSYPIAKQRWLNTRFHPQAMAWFSRVAARSGPRIGAIVEAFDGELVLTVAHGFGWLAAADFAARRKLPLHLMVHDDWPRVVNVKPAFRDWIDARFASVYRQARTRFCVSPAMGSAYEQRYGVSAEVLYPMRQRNAVEFEAPPARVVRKGGPFTVAFAGSINSSGYIEALLALQRSLSAMGGRLLIFGPLTTDEAERCGLLDAHTTLRGLVSATELMTCLREEADALFVPMSFAPEDRTNMTLAFPSKLADCTAVGLPLLVYGPACCSAVTWARENEGVAEVVDTNEGLQLSAAVARLALDPSRRLILAKRALEVGRRYFAHDAVQTVFDGAITGVGALQARL